MAASTPGAVNQEQTETAGFGRRLGGLLIDWALCTLVASLLVDDLRTNPWPQLGVFVLVHAFFVISDGDGRGLHDRAAHSIMIRRT
jgi:hypothetical protein